LEVKKGILPEPSPLGEIVKFILHYLQESYLDAGEQDIFTPAPPRCTHSFRTLLFMATSLGSGARLGTAARNVLSRLRHGAMTVEDLARALKLTNNAVRNQLRKLQEADFVTAFGKRPSASKPSTLYAITLQGQIQFSTLYLPILMQFLEVAEGRCSGTQLDTLMLETGESLARRYPKPSGPLKRRAQSAAGLLRSFGGVAEVTTRDGVLVIRSRACPIAALTSENGAACRVLEGFLERHIAAAVTVCCNLEEEPQCCFEVRG